LRLVQVRDPQKNVHVAVVEEPNLRLLDSHGSVYALAMDAIEKGKRIADVMEPLEETLVYDQVYGGASDWKLLPAFGGVSDERCYVTGTGLTHKASVETRQSMHDPSKAANGAATIETDSMKMYRIGLEGGRPARGKIGASPEWFYKGVGSILRAHGEPLDVPSHGEDGGDEAELAGCYVISKDGQPYRVGIVQGNEFSDHVMESRNYLYLAQSKLRACAIGPEIVIGAGLNGPIHGHAMIERGGKTIWAAPLASGEEHMCHSLGNMEHHHFKHAEHRRPGDAHIHFFGADRFSFKDQLHLVDGDVMVVRFDGFGRALRNPLKVDSATAELLKVKTL